MTQISDAAHEIGGEPFRIGRTLSRSFAIYGRGFLKFATISLLLLLPLLLLKLPLILLLPPKNAQSAVALAGLLMFPLSILVHGACFLGALRELRGESFSVPESLGVALRRFFPLLGIGLAAGFAGLLGILLLIVPGVIIFIMFYVAGPACVLENSGVFGSLTRSRELTKGYRWSIFGLLLVVSLASLAGGVIFGFMAASGAPLLLRAVLEFAWSVVVASFGAVLVSVVYHDLRVAKEGVDVEKLVNVFA